MPHGSRKNKPGPRSQYCPICARDVSAKSSKKHFAKHIDPVLAQGILQRNAIPLTRVGRVRRRPSRSRSRSPAQEPSPGAPDWIPEGHGTNSPDESFVQDNNLSWRAGPPPQDAESSLRGSGVAEDVADSYEGEEDPESLDEAMRADMAEEQDMLDYEQERQFEDNFDNRFWAELEAEVLHSAEHGRT
jgi:hypothetical protein